MSFFQHLLSLASFKTRESGFCPCPQFSELTQTTTGLLRQKFLQHGLDFSGSYPTGIAQTQSIATHCQSGDPAGISAAIPSSSASQPAQLGNGDPCSFSSVSHKRKARNPQYLPAASGVEPGVPSLSNFSRGEARSSPEKGREEGLRRKDTRAMGEVQRTGIKCSIFLSCFRDLCLPLQCWEQYWCNIEVAQALMAWHSLCWLTTPEKEAKLGRGCKWSRINEA